VGTVALINIGSLVTGVLVRPLAEVEAIFVNDGRIAAMGAASQVRGGEADVVIDCQGTTVMPGLIDSHCHVVLGDYTPRQKTVDFLDSYVHGGIRGCTRLAAHMIRWRPRPWPSRPPSATRISGRAA